MTISAAGLRLATLGDLTTGVAYGLVGGTLLVSRLVGLDRGLWLDEITTVDDYVRAGPSEILAGPYIPNNHELFSMLGWATTFIAGDSEVALRLWSTIPFLAGVAVVAVWLHKRVDALSAVLFVLFCTASPLLLDITRQARGYGLAFFAMGVMTVAAAEALRTERSSYVTVVAVAGVVGAWTLPPFALALAATAAVLVSVRELRRVTTLLLAAATTGVVAWYAPHLGDVVRGTAQEYTTPIETRWLLTAPIDQVLIPALIWIDGTVLIPGLVWVPVITLIGVVIWSSPLLREWRLALVLAGGVVATVLFFWIARVDVVPRFFSYLLVPLFMLLATGSASILRRPGTHAQLARTIAVVCILVGSVLAFSATAPDVLQRPREAHRDAAEAIHARAPTAPVFAYMPHPRALEFYLGRRVIRPAGPEDPAVCERRERVALVIQPWVLPSAAFPCLERDGTQRVRFEQYTRGGEIVVWLIPPGEPLD